MESINEYTPLLGAIRDLIKRDQHITVNQLYWVANYAPDFLANFTLSNPLGLHIFLVTPKSGYFYISWYVWDDLSLPCFDLTLFKNPFELIKKKTVFLINL